MTVTPRRTIRVADEVWGRWEEEARARALTVTQLIHAAVEREVGSEVAVEWRPAEAVVAVKPKTRKRTEMCIHRRRPDEYCSRCDG